MNANQRRKARRRGEYTKADLVYADRLARSLYRLDLSHTNSISPVWQTLATNAYTGYTGYNSILKVTVNFDFWQRGVKVEEAEIIDFVP